MNFGEQMKYVKILLGDGSDLAAGRYGRGVLALALNEAAKTISADVQPARTYFDTTTIAYNDASIVGATPPRPETEGRYPLPGPFISVKAIHITYGGVRRQLKRLSYDEFEELYGTSSSGNVPEAFRVEFGATTNEGSPAPGDIWLGPKPNGAYPLRASIYRIPRKIAETGEDDKVMEMAEPFHKLACFRAAMELSFDSDDRSRRIDLGSLYEEGLARAKTITARMDRTGGFTLKAAYGPSRWGKRRRR